MYISPPIVFKNAHNVFLNAFIEAGLKGKRYDLYYILLSYAGRFVTDRKNMFYNIRGSSNN